MANSILIMDGDAMTRALRRIAHEILEHNPDPAAFALIGIPSRGVELARRLADLIKATEGKRPELGAIDISMHRDDLSLRYRLTRVQETHLPLRLEEFTLILVDDVLYTGRSCRAAMDAINDPTASGYIVHEKHTRVRRDGRPERGDQLRGLPRPDQPRSSRPSAADRVAVGVRRRHGHASATRSR